MKKDCVIYQIALRAFTPEGTLNSAAKRIPHIAKLGFDCIYLSSICKEDADPDKKTWSQRQLASGFENPKNPYKIMDYYAIDEEFGNMEDLKAFVQKAHEYGLSVLFDLVYLHCGKNAVFLKEHPDFVLCDEKGVPIVGERWPFARWNFENPAAREYLMDNMKYYIEEIQVDGFRCDVGDQIPIPFWQEAIQRIRKIHPNAIFLNEGWKPEYLDAGFDLDYASCNMIENHDIASDAGKERFISKVSFDAYLQNLFLLYAKEGTPFIWNGNEFADSSELSMFANRFHGNQFIDWDFKETEKGKTTLYLIQKLNSLYHRYPVFSIGKTKILNENAFIRYTDEETVYIYTNAQSISIESGEVLIEIGLTQENGIYSLKENGFAAILNRSKE